MSLLVRELILECTRENLQEVLKTISEKIESNDMDPNCDLPKSLIELCQLYILAHIRRICPNKGVRTSAATLKSISPVGTAFSENLVKTLQKEYSNRIAFRYESYLNLMRDSVEICGIPIEFWGKYVSSSYLRRSSRGIYFAPCMYSMQVSLAHLIFTKAKIAIVNDICGPNDELVEKYVKILVGNGVDGFIPLSLDQEKDLSVFMHEPVVVFSGCAYSETPQHVNLQMDEWANRFANLVLACDVFYPQFPKACSDPFFHDSPIIPGEEILQDVISQHGTIAGVSASDPSFYCLNHIYPSSLKQVIAKELTPFKIPKEKRKTIPEKFKNLPKLRLSQGFSFNSRVNDKNDKNFLEDSKQR